jgi:cytochrome bd-type quinol oxidase subunit 1
VLSDKGVVSGIIMPFQFGTNWSRFTDATADVLSPMTSEAIVLRDVLMRK